MASHSSSRENPDLNILAARRLIGTARVEICCLKFFQGRQTDHRVVDNLLRVFSQSGCLRYDLENYVPVLIFKEDLQRALRASGLDRSALKKAPKKRSLCFLKVVKDQKLYCAHGRHRVEAAKSFFPEQEDHWWIIKLFLVQSKDEFKKLAALWSVNFQHQAVFSDGEIHRQVSARDEAQRQPLTTCLSSSKQTSQKALLNHEGVKDGLNALRDIPGLWGPKSLRYGNAQRFMALRCDEEIEQYLEHIRIVWNAITLGRKGIKEFVDIQTVEALQLRAPGVSSTDRQFTIDAMSRGSLFPKLVDPSKRMLVEKALLNVKCLIPSLESMNANLFYLGVGAGLIKRYVAGDCKSKTLRSTLWKKWTKSRTCMVETSPDAIQSVKHASTEACWDLTYKQLWIFVLREFADLGGQRPKKERGEDLFATRANPNLIVRFLQFVTDLGLDTEIVQTHLRNDPRREELRASIGPMLDLQPAAREKYLENMLCQLPIDARAKTEPHPNAQSKSASDVDDIIRLCDKRRRCGVPFTRAYNEGRVGFYLPKILREGTGVSKNMPSVAFIQKDFIDAFFGPTIDFRKRLRDLPGGNNGGTPGLESVSGYAPSSPDSDLSPLEETLEMGHAYSATIDTPPSPRPALSAMANAAVTGQSVGSEFLPGSRVQNASTSSISSAAGSPVLSPVASISPDLLRDWVSTPAAEEHGQPLTEPATHPAEGQMEPDKSFGPEVPSTELEMLHPVAAAPPQSDSFPMAELPQERPRSPIMSLLQSPPRHLLQYEPASNEAIAQPTDTIELGIHFPSSSPTAEAVNSRRIDFRNSHKSSNQLPSEPRRSILSWPADETIDSTRVDSGRQVSRESSLQLPSEPRRSVLSWPTSAMLEAPDQSVGSNPSALVPYQVPSERESPSSISPTREAMAIDSGRYVSPESSLPSEPRRSVLSWPTDAMLEWPDQDVASYPSALVPHQVPPERESSSSISSTREVMAMDSESDGSSPSSYQLPSEPRRSVLLWPTTAMLEAPDQNVDSHPSALVPYQLPPERILPSSPLAEHERGTLTVYNQRLNLPPDVRRSTLSLLSPNPSSEMGFLQDSDEAGGLEGGTRPSGASPLLMEPAPPSSLRQSEQIDLPPEPRRSVDSLLDSPASASQMDSTSGQVEQPVLSSGAEGSPVSKVGLPSEARQSIDSIHLINQSQETQHPLEPPPPVTQESQGERSADESSDVELVDDPPATTFRFFEYNGASVTPKVVVSRANMKIQIDLNDLRNWIWFKIDRARLRTIRQEKVIDYMARSGGYEYCVMPKDHQLIRKAASALEAHLQRRRKRATTGAVETHQRKRDLQKRKRYGIIRDRSEGNPMPIETGSPDNAVALISHTYPKPLAQDVTAWPDSVAWLSSRPWVVRIKVFDKEHNQEDCEKEQQNPDWPLLSSQLCFLVYTASGRRLLVFDALQPLSGEDERLLCDNFTFVMTARKLAKVELETALKVVPHFPIWLVHKNEVGLFKKWVEDLHSSHQVEHGSPKIQPVAPDVDTLEDDSLFDNDSIDDEFIPVVRDRGHEEEGRLNQDDSNQVASRHFAALPQSATAKSVSSSTFGIAASRSGQNSRGVSPTPTEPRASKPDASLIEAATTPPPAARAPGSENFPGSVPSTQERAKVGLSEVEMPEDPAIQLGLKRPFTPDDAVHVRTRTDQEPERKRPRRDNIMQQSLPREGTVSTSSQADEESELKQLWIERWKEGGDKRKLKIKDRGRKLAGLLEKSKQRKKSKLTPEEIQQRRRGIL